MTMFHGSLFTGYGGLDLAVEEVFDAETIWTSDVELHALGNGVVPPQAVAALRRLI